MQHLELWLHHKTALLGNPNSLLVLAILLIIGYIATKFARKLHLPAVTAQIVGGILVGHYVLNIFSDETFAAFSPITAFALGFIGFTIGSHLNFRKLHNSGKRILFIAFTDNIFTPLIVYLA